MPSWYWADLRQQCQKMITELMGYGAKIRHQSLVHRWSIRLRKHWSGTSSRNQIRLFTGTPANTMVNGRSIRIIEHPHITRCQIHNMV